MVVMPSGIRMPAPGTVYGSLWVLTWTGSSAISSEPREGENNLYVYVQGTAARLGLGWQQRQRAAGSDGRHDG